MWTRLRDRGAATLEYLAAIAMVVAIFTVISTAEMGQQITQALSTSVCRITQVGNCDAPAGDQADPGDQGDQGDPGNPPGDEPPADDPGDATESEEEREAREAVEALDAIEQEAAQAEGEYENIDKEILQFLSELIGLDAAIRCVKEGDIVACLETAATLAPWGKALKILSKIPKAIKLFKRFKGLWDKVRDLRRRRQAARDRYNAICPGTGNSFTPGTPVLLANGSHIPIERIRAGHRVAATDVTTGIVSARPVTAVWTSIGRKSLVNIAIDLDGRPGGTREKITATAGHPFWVEGIGWMEAGNLRARDRLSGSDGAHPAVIEISEFTRVQRVHNLTVADRHTYHVAAGPVDVLVHNTAGTKPRPRACGPEPPRLDASGKVHTPPGESLPRFPPKNWTRDQLEDLADDLRTSIRTRKDELGRLGDEPGHRNRIREEEALLRAIEKKLSGS